MEEAFKLVSDYTPSGDQPQAINQLVENIKNGVKHQVLLGATGTGKTYTISNVIEQVNKPVLVLAHNKTLAGQLYSEFKQLFPNNNVEFFISYYDYYQPEAYVASKDLYIDKTSSINDEIDQLRHSATAAILSSRQTIVVASVSCIYSIGDPDSYQKYRFTIREGQTIERETLIRRLVELLYDRNDYEFVRGTFRVRGDSIDIIPNSYSDIALRIELFGDEIDAINEIDTLTGKLLQKHRVITIFPASHFIVDADKREEALIRINRELEKRIAYFEENKMLLEAQRLKERTNLDIDMIRETGFCSGIENYSLHMALREYGSTPSTLIDFFKKDFLLVVDESHATLPQVRGMFNGDRSRKQALVDHGFRLPSALDNRPLNFDEFNEKLDQVIYVSATPAEYEIEKSSKMIVEQIIRPTGLLDPVIEVCSKTNQIDDIISKLQKVIAKNERALITTLTIKMSEDLTNYLKEIGIKVAYLHSEIKSLERLAIIRDLRQGKFDCVVGINLLREGLDIPEVSTIFILDADKEGFLRNEKSLIQTIGRAARNANGCVYLYADKVTRSMQYAIDETARRRSIQITYNEEHGITPKTIVKEILEDVQITYEEVTSKKLSKTQVREQIEDLTKLMHEAAKELDFEAATKYRDAIFELEAEL